MIQPDVLAEAAELSVIDHTQKNLAIGAAIPVVGSDTGMRASEEPWCAARVHPVDRLRHQDAERAVKERGFNPLAAPLRADLRGMPPVCVLLAELDVLRSEGEALVRKLRAAGVDTETRTFSGVVHGFLRATESVTKARDAVAAAGAWMKRVGV